MPAYCQFLYEAYRRARGLSSEAYHLTAEEKSAWEEAASELIKFYDPTSMKYQLDQANERVAELQRKVVDAERHYSELKIGLADRLAEERQAMRAEFAEAKRKEAELTAKRSRDALVGKISEHLSPLVPGFPYNLKEVRHVGEMFDFLVYRGLEAGRIEEVVFLEVKSGPGGRKNPRERMLRDAIDGRRVRYSVFIPELAGAKEFRAEPTG